LKFSVSHATVASEPGYAHVTEAVWGSPHACLLDVLRDDLLDPPRAELAVSLRLEEPAVLGVGGDVRSQRSGEGLAEKDEAVLAAFAEIDADLARFEIHVSDKHVAEFADPDARVEEQPQHQGVLHVLGTIHNLIEAAELLTG
jgi:hypothetical protein